MDSTSPESEGLPSSSAKDTENTTKSALPSRPPTPPAPSEYPLSFPSNPPILSESIQTHERATSSSTLPPTPTSARPSSSPAGWSESVETSERAASPSALPPTPSSRPPKTPAVASQTALPPTPPSHHPTPPTSSEDIQTLPRVSSSSTLPSTPPLDPNLHVSSESVQTRTITRVPSLSTLPSTKASLREGGKISSTDKQRELYEHTDAEGPPDPIDQLLAVDKPPLPKPRPPSSCPIFCCFYAEFDIVVGPKVAFQSPRTFMDQDTGIATEDIHQLLQETFERVQAENETKKTESTEKTKHRNQESLEDGETGTSTDNVDVDSQQLSIFDATSEYIITGNELAGKMINLSTHNMHILSRPTAIANERYARNALLFSVGFVLRRDKDPRPFRPLLTKWADALRSMEVEHQFLANPAVRPKLQRMLDRLLISLNSLQCECNLLLDSANALNLRAVRPPKPPALPVPDHAVPILVREDLLSLYDWDLAIKWVALFIDGVHHARWIATKSDVDMEMVRACLRVLKHHGVIELVDMFFYSNRYEFTERATGLLAGKDPKLLEEAIDYTARRHQRSTNTSPVGVIGEDYNPDFVTQASSTRQSDRSFRPISENVMSFPPENSLLASSMFRVGSKSKEIPRSFASRYERKRMMLVLAELYCSCHRNISFAELRISKVAVPSSLSTTQYKRDSRGSTNADAPTELVEESTGRESHLRRCSTAESERSADVRGRKLSDLSDLDSKSNIQQGGIDWKEAFEVLDHRRCMIFGVVHGLLRRVHNFPLAIVSKKGGIYPEATQTNDPKNASTSMRKRGVAFRSTDSNNGLKASFSLASRIADMMDGSNSDDELVCEFERPLYELIELVEGSGKKVVSIYAPAPG